MNTKNAKLSLSFFKLFFIMSSLVSCSLLDDPLSRDKDLSPASDLLAEEDTTSLNFFVFGDWGYNGSDNQYEVKSEMALIAGLVAPEFIVSSGDNFHNTGVSSISDPLWQSNYENVYSDVSLKIPWYPALGNHDYIGDPDAQVGYTAINEYWNMPARYYTFTKSIQPDNKVRFVVLDTYGLLEEFKNLQDTSEYFLIEQYSWLKDLMPGVEEKWIIVIGHHPVFSASPFHDDDTEFMKKLIKPLLDTYKVDFYFSGHDHDFEHAREMGKTTEYVVTGTGALPTPVGSESTTLFSMSKLGFTYISMTSSDVELFFITADDRIPYSYIRAK